MQSSLSSEFVPFSTTENIRITNKFPREKAPNGLNYYVPIDRLPLECLDANYFLGTIYRDSAEHFAGIPTFRANVFQTLDWRRLQRISTVEVDHLYSLGYNSIRSMQGIGIAVWGEQVVYGDTNFALADLLSLVNLLQLTTNIAEIIGDPQRDLFANTGIMARRLENILCANFNAYMRSSNASILKDFLVESIESRYELGGIHLKARLELQSFYLGWNFSYEMHVIQIRDVFRVAVRKCPINEAASLFWNIKELFDLDYMEATYDTY